MDGSSKAPRITPGGLSRRPPTSEDIDAFLLLTEKEEKIKRLEAEIDFLEVIVNGW